VAAVDIIRTRRGKVSACFFYERRGRKYEGKYEGKEEDEKAEEERREEIGWSGRVYARS
jgi:hypothetical protein